MIKEYKISSENVLPIAMKDSLVELGFVVNGVPVSFNEFKKRSTTLKYGRGQKANFITYFGECGVKMLKVYSFIMSAKQSDNIKEAYRVLCECAKGNDEHDNFEINLCRKYSITY